MLHSGILWRRKLRNCAHQTRTSVFEVQGGALRMLGYEPCLRSLPTNLAPCFRLEMQTGLPATHERRQRPLRIHHPRRVPIECGESVVCETCRKRTRAKSVVCARCHASSANLPKTKMHVYMEIARKHEEKEAFTQTRFISTLERRANFGRESSKRVAPIGAEVTARPG